MGKLHQLWAPIRTAVTTRWHLARIDDRGSIFTEYGAVAALAIGGAIVVLGIIVAVATGWANSIPGAGGG